MSLRVVPLTLREARAFVTAHHRHHRAPQGGLYAVGVALGDQVRGAAIIGRPVARMLDDGWTAEVTRLATLGDHNACSMLYGAAWRACRALGWRKLITYTLAEEGGVASALQAGAASGRLAAGHGRGMRGLAAPRTRRRANCAGR